MNDFNSSIRFDQRMIAQDMRGSGVHAAMLAKPAGNDAGWMKLPCESVKTHEREDVTADYLISGQFLDSFARSLMDRPNRLMKPAESA